MSVERGNVSLQVALSQILLSVQPINPLLLHISLYKYHLFYGNNNMAWSRSHYISNIRLERTDTSSHSPFGLHLCKTLRQSLPCDIGFCTPWSWVLTTIIIVDRVKFSVSQDISRQSYNQLRTSPPMSIADTCNNECLQITHRYPRQHISVGHLWGGVTGENPPGQKSPDIYPPTDIDLWTNTSIGELCLFMPTNPWTFTPEQKPPWTKPLTITPGQ